MKSLMCHQCQMHFIDYIYVCSNCKIRQYCYTCLKLWYPNHSTEDVEKACPFCRGNCNCSACLLEYKISETNQEDATRRIQQLLYLIFKTLPLLKKMNEEQVLELGMEAKIHDNEVSEKDIPKAKLDKRERLYWLLKLVLPHSTATIVTHLLSTFTEVAQNVPLIFALSAV